MLKKNLLNQPEKMENLILTENFHKKEDLNREAHMTLILYKLWIEKGSKTGNKINTEDIANAAFKNWPEEYSWNKEEYSHWPDMDKLRRALENARKSHWVYGHKDNKNLSNDGYTLTEQGLNLSKKYAHLLDEKIVKKAPNTKNTYIKNYLSRIKNSEYFKCFKNGDKDTITSQMSIHDVSAMIETSTSNMTRFNEKFNNTKLYIQTYENDDDLINFFRFIEDLFDDIDLEIIIKNNTKISKSKKGFEKGFIK